MKIIVALAMAGIAFLYLCVYLLVDSIITRHRLKTNQKAWDEYSANMDFDRKMDAYLPCCTEQKMKNGWDFYYFPRM